MLDLPRNVSPQFAIKYDLCTWVVSGNMVLASPVASSVTQSSNVIGPMSISESSMHRAFAKPERLKRTSLDLKQLVSITGRTRDISTYVK